MQLDITGRARLLPVNGTQPKPDCLRVGQTRQQRRQVIVSALPFDETSRTEQATRVLGVAQRRRLGFLACWLCWLC